MQLTASPLYGSPTSVEVSPATHSPPISIGTVSGRIDVVERLVICRLPAEAPPHRSLAALNVCAGGSNHSAGAKLLDF